MLWVLHKKNNRGKVYFNLAHNSDDYKPWLQSSYGNHGDSKQFFIMLAVFILRCVSTHYEGDFSAEMVTEHNKKLYPL